MMEELFGFRQRKLVENHLTNEDTFIFNGIINCINKKKEFETIDNKNFYRVYYKDFYEVVPFTKKISTLNEKIKNLASKGFLIYRASKKESFLVSFNEEMMMNILMKDRIRPEDLIGYDIEELRKEIDSMLNKMDLVDLIGIRIYAGHTINGD